MEIQKQKEDIINKFEKMRKANKEIDEEEVKKLFPDDEELYQHIKKMREDANQQQEEDKEIERKVEEYRNKLRSELDSLIKEEREKENQIVKEYEKATDINKKEALEKSNAKERADGNQKVTRKQKEIDDKVRKYEDNLRHNSQK